jgi:hypothetical protein
MDNVATELVGMTMMALVVIFTSGVMLVWGYFADKRHRG